MEELNLDNGLLWIWEQQTDFLLLNGSNLPNLYEQDNIIYEYNQWKTNDCTIYSAFWAVSDLMNYEFTEQEIKDINELSYSRGRIRWNWWYVASAVKCVADRWNTHHKELWKVAYYRIDLRDDELVDQILDKWYTLCSGYQWNYKYNTDFAQDSKLDESSFGEKTYWHAVSWRKINWVRCIKDNYKWHTYKWNDINKYAVIPSCSKEVEDWTYFVWAYLFTKVAEDNYEELKRLEKFKTTLNIAIEANSALRHLTNDKKYQNRLHTLNETHRKKMKDIEEQVALHS